MNRNEILNKSLSELVIENFNFVEIFERNDIDYCCNGNTSLVEICKNKNLSTTEILNQIDLRIVETTSLSNFLINASFTSLIDYLVCTHHSFIRNKIKTVFLLGKRVEEFYKEQFPVLTEVYKLLESLNSELKIHMMKEEEILFDEIKKYEEEGNQNSQKNTLMNLSSYFDEHEYTSDILHKIKQITNNYLIPENFYSEHKTFYSELKIMDEDLHKHIFIENYFLFNRIKKILST